MNNVIIVAGGKGLRMGSELPKQFLNVGGKPVLMRTIEAFYNFDKSIRIIVALSASYREHWSKLCKGYGFSVYHEVVDGGETRFHSVKNGLELVGEGWVAVHDAVRPFASVSLLKTCFDAAKEYKAVIPVIDVTDSLREIDGENDSKIVDRSKYRMVQTPQVFESVLLKKAYDADFSEYFTDDSSVVEAYGHAIHLVEGERTNIKITTPFDLDLGEVILGK
ncbi:2-C-methyl-D-erythritol 4-phosphate cytidylyltransferase [Dysgonomonas alginatilytica]|uniref:2-C-methyl-D-erythritol 4-phosphate cytidylyltransferase n=1 Tax=Dysgonomonas alginatilytica TaxID=1605892 RepID=A0A2V3PLF4_9BACT|nr:2-C-methyl-D-erythritol 4-phosphate cytidylyltransferase [Dysgonomonas alginatilytica]PXV62519.1 2-C-methyl-D-erythritol 4-phosphate cytidylyltransferase [Dysgonomonas alginatilytica]